MKKKLFSFMLAFVLLLTGVFCLTACGEKEKKFYYTVGTTPEHCEFQIVSGSHGTDDKGDFVYENQEITLRVFPAEGYASSNLKILINGVEVTTTNTETALDVNESRITAYKYTFTPTENFDITFSGEFNNYVKDFTLIKANSFNAADENNQQLYIRFGENNGFNLPTTEISYVDFVTNHLNEDDGIIKHAKYGDTFDFYVYTKGYKGKPNFCTKSAEGYGSNIDGVELYQNGNKIGYHYTFEQRYYPTTLSFENVNFSTQHAFIDQAGGEHYTPNLGSKKLKMQLSNTLPETLTISFNRWNDIDDEIKDTFAKLKLKINDKFIETADFTDENSNGVLTFNLGYPNDYVVNPTADTEYKAFGYYVDFNYYDIPYLSDPKLKDFQIEIFDSSVVGKSFIFANIEVQRASDGSPIDNGVPGYNELEAEKAQYNLSGVYFSFDNGGDNGNLGSVSVINPQGSVVAPFKSAYNYTFFRDHRENTVEIYSQNENELKFATNFIGDFISLKIPAASNSDYVLVFTFSVFENNQ